MKKSKNVVTRAAVSKIISKWRKILLLDSRWNLTFDLYQTGEWPYPQGENDIEALITPDIGYFTGYIEFNVPMCENSRDTLEHIVLHELIHLTLAPLGGIAKASLGDAQAQHFHDVDEAVTETVTRALLKAAATSPPVIDYSKT